MSFLAPARAADAGRARGLPAPRRLRLRLRGGRQDRPPDAGDLPPARGPGAPLHRREPAAVRRSTSRARRARSQGFFAAAERGRRRRADRAARRGRGRPRRRRWQGPAVVRADRRARTRSRGCSRAWAVRSRRLGAHARAAPDQRPAWRHVPGPARRRLLGDVVRGRRRPGGHDPLDRQPRQARPPRCRRKPSRGHGRRRAVMTARRSYRVPTSTVRSSGWLARNMPVGS